MERPMPTSDEKLMAMLIYLTSFFTTFIGPLIIWLMKREDSEFVDFHGKEYLNFLISYTIYSIVASLLMLILIGFVLLPVVGILAFVFTIIAAVKSYGGETYRIPTVIRFIK
ncbi:DUF4870 domain-containing protein [Rossellomorea marisflavi]|uniref:Uncharacterized protein n=3 Tax=Bacillaceae TaxID=186817 RepID=A0A0J5SPV1_9BACI|nr:DUF4870 domain-containing protein [Rossellomorea marisflavi]KMK97451.1 hypothetical protein VL03_01755 [Rossellomorea marisflavi]KMK99190.1 hypothetical protein VL06_21790 [Rossellomorea marisflavi]KML33952.1 hypothetical protein VL12_06725 [Rossellomorea marisflavi]KZE45489.1 hypothetical protein AV649_04665 [Rossellomorea marisflavi]MCM2604875.1 DUF4870 domain-containing protein [Rossellomorea marisflavi]